MSIRFVHHAFSGLFHRTTSPVSYRLLGTLFLIPFLFVACDKDTPSDDGITGDTTSPNRNAEIIDTAGLPVFSGQNAYDYVTKQVAIGPRNPGSPGAKAAIAFYMEELGKYADHVQEQKFTHTGYENRTYNLSNIIASFNPDAGVRILLCAHWDTRPRADWDPDSSKQDMPILGANDGGSGVGVLLELARIFKEHPLPIGVDIVLFDGEDYGDNAIDRTAQYFLGARHFSSNLPQGYRPAFGILLDLVGDKNAEFPKEAISRQYAEPYVDALWQVALKMGLNSFKQRNGPRIEDDHLILNEQAGIPTLDIIDTDLVGHRTSDPRRKYWHTHKDDMSNIGAGTLEEVGRLVVYTVYRWLPAQVQPAS